VLVELRGDGRVQISRHHSGEWQDLLETPLAIDRSELGDRRLMLRCDEEGRIDLSLAREVLVSRDLGRLAHAGWVGLFAAPAPSGMTRSRACALFLGAQRAPRSLTSPWSWR